MRLAGWRYGVFVGSFVGLIGLHCYISMIRPMLNPEPYSICQKNYQILNSNIYFYSLIINIFQKRSEKWLSKIDLYKLSHQIKLESWL
ncbi:hypothetical protein EAI_14627 [Harpegnathos saltator]|uniref:Uncharacterized protein n=1 Tax=Harpegnathos saltator TaxID=610380 RepID=E2BG10_HARSA|nr:hypothetical protein EAI_14627 [Harpegnathos saltator]